MQNIQIAAVKNSKSVPNNPHTQSLMDYQNMEDIISDSFELIFLWHNENGCDTLDIKTEQLNKRNIDTLTNFLLYFHVGVNRSGII